MKNAMLSLVLVLFTASCSHDINRCPNSSSIDPIEALFNITAPMAVQKSDINPASLLKVTPNAHIDAGIVLAENPWEQEFILEAISNGVEIGETTAKCDSPMQISFVKESEKMFRLIVTITPRIEKPDFRCQVKIPVIEPQGARQLDLLITGRVRI